MKKLMTGNEALVRGAWEAGVILHQLILVLPVQKFWKTCLVIKKCIPNGHQTKK